MKNFLFITILFLFLFCENNKSNPTDEQESYKANVSAASGVEISPCDLVSETAVKKLLSIPENIPSDIDNTVRTYPTCFYKWETVKFTQTKKFGGKDVSIDYPTEMTIVLVKNATEKMFETSTKVYKDGQVQNGIGDRAIWGGKMSQLTFLSDGYMIHLHVRMSSNEVDNQEIATKIAVLIIESL